MSAKPTGRPSVSELAQGVGAVALTAIAWIGLRRLDVGGETHAGALFALGLLVLTGTVLGSLAAFAGLPRLIGYLLAGMICGPQGLTLLSPGEVRSLSLVNALALALIALQAGAELTLPTLRRIWKSVVISSILQIALVVSLMAVSFVVLAPAIPFTQALEQHSLYAIAVVWGVLMLTRSPTVTIAVLAETKAKGPLSEHALGVVVLLDVLVLPLFAAALALARGQMLGVSFELHAFAALGEEIFASLCAGVTFGLVLAGLLRVTKEHVLVLVVFGYALTALCSYLHYDTLLVFVVAGFIVMNLTKLGNDLVHTSERTAAVVMVVFFATAGAKLDLQSLALLWPVALGFFAIRLALTFVSARAGHLLARDPPVVKKYAWLAFISQAGVTIGLATIISDSLPVVGKPLASLVIAVVAVSTIVGAIVFKVALARAGEIPKEAP